MASITWTCVFALLIVELIVTIILVLPVPRNIRNAVARCIFRFHLGDRFSKGLWFIAVALVLALVDSYFNVERLMEKMQIVEDQDMMATATGHPGHHHHHHDKQKLYKAERNMYLAGFALTLLFVIGRILQLMQESVELEDQLTFATTSDLQLSQSVDDNGVKRVEVTEKNLPPKQLIEKKKDWMNSWRGEHI